MSCIEGFVRGYPVALSCKLCLLDLKRWHTNCLLCISVRILLLLEYHQHFPGEMEECQRDTPIRIAGVAAGIRKEHDSNASLELYVCPNHVGVSSELYADFVL
jgi:hypothetical protein